MLFQRVGESADVLADVLPREPGIAGVVFGSEGPTQQRGHAVNATAAASIRLVEVRKEYADGTVAVNDLSLEIPAGELVVLVGPSGCGKSTILRMVNRLIELSSGRIYLGDEDVTGADPVQLRR